MARFLRGRLASNFDSNAPQPGDCTNPASDTDVPPAKFVYVSTAQHYQFTVGGQTVLFRSVPVGTVLEIPVTRWSATSEATNIVTFCY